MASPKQLNGPLGALYDPTGQTPIAGYRGSMTAGSGITSGAGTLYRSVVTQEGQLIKTTIFIDLTGLNSGGADGDIIGKNSTANCHLGQITAALNGTIFKGSISCVEVPATGEPDIDVYSANEATGTEDAAITGLVETALLQSAADFTAVGQTRTFTGAPPANDYLYLVASGGVTDATYTAGQFVLELWGIAL